MEAVVATVVMGVEEEGVAGEEEGAMEAMAATGEETRMTTTTRRSTPGDVTPDT